MKVIKKLLLFLFGILAKLLAIMPRKLFYLFSNFIAWNLYIIFGYRLKVVKTNLRNSFPEKSEAEIKKITAAFYRNLSDTILETIALYKQSAKSMNKMVHILNPELIQEVHDSGKSVFFAIGHTANWELLASYLSINQPFALSAIYKKLSDDNSDALMKRLRQRFGKLELFESKSAYKNLLAKKTQQQAVLILGDQTPLKRDSHFWMKFLNQDTSFFIGLERMASKLDYAVIYLEFCRLARGSYSLKAIEICRECTNLPDNSITLQYAQLLEKTIHARPDAWLWSHKRWKHKPNKS